MSINVCKINASESPLYRQMIGTDVKVVYGWGGISKKCMQIAHLKANQGLKVLYISTDMCHDSRIDKLRNNLNITVVHCYRLEYIQDLLRDTKDIDVVILDELTEVLCNSRAREVEQGWHPRAYARAYESGTIPLRIPYEELYRKVLTSTSTSLFVGYKQRTKLRY